MEISRRNSKCITLDSFLSNLTKGIIMDINRNKRKSVRDETNEFSQQSILSAMDRFVHAVNNMDDTIMVPSRLMDMTMASDVPPKNGPDAPRTDVNSDLFGFYNMLNSVKNELIWGPADSSHSNNSNKDSTKNTDMLSRRMSTVSLHSYSDSDVESESSTDFDSGVDFDEHSLQVASAFRQHLTGLYQALHQLTDAANYLTTRYQEEVDGAS
uniref:Mid1-interacting protein 1-B n=1 Tax=Scolopendra viridis TaxID=118503 RepID=A0A4D5R910_SCOVI